MTEHSLLTPAWVERLSHYHLLYIGLSGGLDSVALLHGLAANPILHPKIHAVHINHGLSPHALTWERHCEQFCQTLAIPLSIHRVDIPFNTNLEERAREARYGVFKALLTPADGLVLAHHQDDQAETMLLNLMRGAGIDGMAAMPAIQSSSIGDVLRPLLSIARSEILAYALSHHLCFVDDESNLDQRFSRNFLRHRILPLLQDKWPAAIKNIARAASHCQQAHINLEALARIDAPDMLTCSNRLTIQPLKYLTQARMSNVLRAWLKHNGHQRPSEKTLLRVIEEVVLARKDSCPQVLFGDVIVRRYQDDLYCVPRKLGIVEATVWSQFPHPLSLGPVTLQVRPSLDGLCVPIGSCIEVRFRIGGETIHWHGQTKSLKKLLQQWQVPPWMRDAIPLIYIDNVLACVVGYAVSDIFYKEGFSSQKMVTIY